MMEHRTEFQEIGKRMPYRVPDGYMAALQQRIVAQAAEETRRDARQKARRKRLTWFAAASLVAAVFVGAVAFHQTPDNTDATLAEQANEVYAQMSAVDQEVIDDCLDDDIFLTLTL